MAFIQLNDASLAFGDRDILASVNFTLHSGDKKALAGVNGSGKTTLLKILSGQLAPDSGTVSSSPEARTGYLPQQGIVHQGRKLEEEADTAFAFFHELEKKRLDMEEELSSLDQESPALETLLEKHHQVLEQLNTSGYYHRSGRIAQVLSGLGFSQEELSRPTETFSGGWQMRIALGKILLANPDFLLLDEPTNYLDLEARDWLTGFLAQFGGGMCIVSHDRYFLDSTIDAVAEIHQARLRIYPGNYSSFEKERVERINRLEKDYQKQQEEIRKHEDFIARFRYNSSKAALVQSRIKLLDKIERIEIPPSAKKIRFRFPDPPHSGKHMLRLQQLGKHYGEACVIEALDLEIMRGEKIVLTGPNGSGKSTLMRIMAGVDNNYSGSIRYGTGVAPGYFSQDFEKEINGPLSILDYMEQQAPTALVPQLRDMLGAFLFSGDDIYKALSVLSGGEKSRIAMLSLLLSPCNLLLLDEPTNHLDLASKDVLLDALDSYKGTVVFVSHDRDFIEQLATRVVHLGERPIRSYPGDYRYFLSQCSETPDRVATEQHPEQAAAGNDNRDREQRKRNKMELKRLQAREAGIIHQIETLAAEEQELLAGLSDPASFADGELTKKLKNRLEALRDEDSQLHQEWEETMASITDIEALIPEA